MNHRVNRFLCALRPSRLQVAPKRLPRLCDPTRTGPGDYAPRRQRERHRLHDQQRRFPPGGGEKFFISLVISGEPSPEVSVLPSGGEEDAVFTAISGEPGLEALREKAHGTRTRIRTNTYPNYTEAYAAGKRGLRVCCANGTCENQGAWVAKSLTKSEALAGYAHRGEWVTDWRRCLRIIVAGRQGGRNLQPFRQSYYRAFISFDLSIIPGDMPFLLSPVRHSAPGCSPHSFPWPSAASHA
jgi:hypothetical protein